MDDQAETVLLNLLRGAGTRRPGRHAAPDRAIRSSGCGGPRPGPCAPPRARAGAGPVERRSPVPAQPGPPRAAPPVLGDRRARRGAGAGPPGRAAGRRRPTCSTSWRPPSTRPTGPPWPPPPRRWPGGPPGGGCATTGPTLRTWPPSSGCWRVARGEAPGHRRGPRRPRPALGRPVVAGRGSSGPVDR